MKKTIFTKSKSMQTFTVDILNNKALRLLQDLELLQLIRLRKEKSTKPNDVNWQSKYKGAMTKQPISDIDAQLDELRSEWQ